MPSSIGLAGITYERLRRVMTGKAGDDKEFEWIKSNEALGGNLTVIELDSVSAFENTKGKTAFDVIDETLYGFDKPFTTKREKIEWVSQNFEETLFCEQKKKNTDSEAQDD